MRISDWSSDVCSSELEEEQRGVERERACESGALDHPARQLGRKLGAGIGRQPDHLDLIGGDLVEQIRVEPRIIFAQRNLNILGDAQRSEEHTSELQTLMRISYAVFCLKKTTRQ